MAYITQRFHVLSNSILKLIKLHTDILHKSVHIVMWYKITMCQHLENREDTLNAILLECISCDVLYKSEA